MAEIVPARLLEQLGLKAIHRRRQPVVWALALVTGVIVGYAVLAFRWLIDLVSLATFGAGEKTILAVLHELPAWHILAVPTLGGLFIGCVLQFLMKNATIGVVPDVIEARALHPTELDLGHGLRSAAIAAVSLGVGASAGREGPAVHLGATLAAFVARRLGYPPALARTFLGAGAAAAVSASFNAPIAGVLFALEVILGRYGLRTFAPIVIAAVSATIVNRLHHDDMPLFQLPGFEIRTLWEMPAFAILGIVSGLAAIVFMKAIFTASAWTDRLKLPLVARPAIAGFLVGLIALVFPEVMGVGYGTTLITLQGGYGLWFLIGCAIAKIAATAVSLAGRFGGGVFSPSLILGGLVGGAFGLIATHIGPAEASEPGAYALVGMGAVAAAVLGAPISTSLIVFELVGDYRLAIGLLVAASIATVFTQSLFGSSFFHAQLARRGVEVADGPHRIILDTIRAREVMEPAPEGAAADPATGPVIFPSDSLKRVLDLFEATGRAELPVVTVENRTQILGTIRRHTALQAFTKALIDANIEAAR